MLYVYSSEKREIFTPTLLIAISLFRKHALSPNTYKFIVNYGSY
jgi:hypothetical protein